MPSIDRRVFLNAAGLLGAVAATPGLEPALAHAESDPDAAARAVRQALTTLTHDTMSGLAVFVVPGPDPYSRVQGTPRGEPGGIEARVPEFLVETLDRFMPFPDQLAVPILRALRQGAGSLALPAARGGSARNLDQGLRRLLENDATIPLSPVVALLLNLEAVRVNPLSIAGPFVSPFPRLTFAQKARVFQLLEGPDPALVAVFDRQLPEPLRGSVSGLLKFLGGLLPGLTGLGAYSEWAVFDPATKRLRDRPVGWRISG